MGPRDWLEMSQLQSKTFQKQNFKFLPQLILFRFILKQLTSQFAFLLKKFIDLNRA